VLIRRLPPLVRRRCLRRAISLDDAADTLPLLPIRRCHLLMLLMLRA